ncbi:hypothetical protein JCM8097_009080 [Rhodosporidiobolus ruineniae]
MPSSLPDLDRVFRKATRDGDAHSVTTKQLRAGLDEVEGWTCSDQEWKGGLREQIKDRWQAMLNDDDDEDDAPASPPPKKKQKTSKGKKPVQEATDEEEEDEEEDGMSEDEEEDDKPRKKTKYERLAEKNLSTILKGTGGLGGALVHALGGGGFGGAGGSDDEEDAGDDPGASDSSAPKKEKKDKKPRAPKSASKPKPKPKKRTSSSKAGVKQSEIKSAEFVDESDDSSHEVAVAGSDDGGGSGSGSGKGKGRKRKSVAGEGEGKKGKGKGKEKKEKPLKEGEEPKGTWEEEERIKKLKALLSTAAPSSRPFTASTGAERSLTVARRTEILEQRLADLGLPVAQGGKLPSLEKARRVGEKREMEREMNDLQGTPLHAGLRDGKPVHADFDSDSEGGSGRVLKKHNPHLEARREQLLVERKSFGAFLGDQEESDPE